MKPITSTNNSTEENLMIIELKNYLHSPSAMNFTSFLRLRGWSFDQIVFNSISEKKLLIQAGNNVFDTKENFMAWLFSVIPALGYQMPIEFLESGQVTLIIDELKNAIRDNWLMEE